MKIIFLIILIIISPIFPQASKYSFETELSPIKISYEAYFNILFKVLKYIENVNDIDTTSNEKNIVFVIRNSGINYTYYNLDISKIMRDVPNVSYDLSFHYESYHNKISELSINFSDNYRSISLEGKSYENCQALISMLEKEFNQYEIILGGSIFRLWGGIILLIFGNLVFWLPQILKSTKTSIYILSILFGILLIVSVYALPWDIWLPGFEIFLKYKSILEEYGGELSLIGILLTILSIFLSIYLNKNKTLPEKVISEIKENSEDAN